MSRPQNHCLDAVEVWKVDWTPQQGEDRSAEEQNHPEKHLLVSIAYPRNKTNHHDRCQNKHLNEINQTPFRLGITVFCLSFRDCFGGAHQRCCRHSPVVAGGS